MGDRKYTTPNVVVLVSRVGQQLAVIKIDVFGIDNLRFNFLYFSSDLATSLKSEKALKIWDNSVVILVVRWANQVFFKRTIINVWVKNI